MAPIIEVRELTKEFRTFRRREGVLGALENLFVREHVTVHAVDRVSFTIEPGEMVGYIGANGAGKSTTIKMLTGILVPTGGVVVSYGYVPYGERRRYTKHLGVVFGQRTQLWWDIAVIESFKLLKEIYGVSEADYRRRLDKFAEILNVKEYLHTPVRKLSLGERMRCDLAASLLHNPPLLFLDEPTIGLDVVAKDHIREFLKEVNRTEGTTVLLTTHDLSAIEELIATITPTRTGLEARDRPSLATHFRTYGAFVRVAFVTTRAYRPPNYTAIVTYFIHVSVYYSIWKATSAHSARIGGVDFSQI